MEALPFILASKIQEKIAKQSTNKLIEKMRKKNHEIFIRRIY